MTESEEQGLLVILNLRNHSLFYDFIVEHQLTPRDLIEFDNKHQHKDFTYMIWSASTTWGFEVLWNEQYSLPEAQRDVKAEDLPKQNTLFPDKPLADHAFWAPQDQLMRLQS